MRPAELTQIIVNMGSLWPMMKFPDDVDAARMIRDQWFELLGDFDRDVVRAAVQWFANEGREFPPSPGQVAQRARWILDPLSHPPDVDVALDQIHREISRVGRAGIPEFTHPSIAATVAAIGWSNICNSTNPDTLRAHILRVYSTSVARHERMEAISPSVRGVIENVASALGLERGT
jgi:hypothetical protein